MKLYDKLLMQFGDTALPDSYLAIDKHVCISRKTKNSLHISNIYATVTIVGL